MSGGIVIGIESPLRESNSYVFMTALLKKEIFLDDLPEDIRRYMVDKVSSVLEHLKASATLRHRTNQSKESGKNIKQEEIDKIADNFWRRVSKTVNIEKVQEVVENVYGISHHDIVGNKRAEEIAEPRHVVMYLAHDLCHQHYCKYW